MARVSVGAGRGRLISMARGKPVIRVLRHLARTGGTLVTKCLGSMDRVVVLSELHPKNLSVTAPMAQAVEWFGLVEKRQVSAWAAKKGPTFLQFVAACESGASRRGDALVLRDWSHLDYYGLPYVAEPGMGSDLIDAVGGAYEVRVACTTRHPVDQYLSLRTLKVIGEVDLDLFLRGNLAFAAYARAHGYVRYEDFTREPDAKLREICAMLDVEFDPGYADRWWSYEQVTGDVKRGNSRGVRENAIRPLERKPVDEGVLAMFRADERYGRICEMLGYEP